MRLSMHTMTIAALGAGNLWLASAAGAQASSGVDDCRQALDECVIAAQTPAEIEVCSAQDARCVAGEMDVPVPDQVPVEQLIECTTTAADCAHTAINADSLTSCQWALDACMQAALDAQYSCIDRFTLCVATEPALLPICSLELLVCTD